MLITELKPKDSIMPFTDGNTFIIICEGCKEVYFPAVEAAGFTAELLDSGAALASVTTDYICNPDNLNLQLRKHSEKINAADSVLVFSCGIGTQTVAENFTGKKVYAACDTYPLPGNQGVTPLEYDCAQCGECHLNATGGICPITACSKSLVNGQCGGAKEGRCEVDKDMECGWERIYRRLEKQGRLDALNHPAKLRDFAIKYRNDE